MHQEIPFRVTDACVAHCTFCAQHVPRRTPDLATDEVLVRLRRALISGRARRIVLTGGEPTLHPRFPDVVRLARQLGCEEVVVESIGVPLAHLGRVQQLVEAGLDEVRMTAVGEDDAAALKVSRLDGVVTAQRVAAQNCKEVGLRLVAQTPLLAGTVERLGAIAGLVAELGAERWILQPYSSGRDGAPDQLHLDLRQVEAVLSLALSRARGAGIVVAVPPGKGYHWCAFAQPHKVAVLLARTGATGRRYLPHCEACTARQQCPGIERSLVERQGAAAVDPIVSARAAAWLPVHGAVDRGHGGRHQELAVERAGSDGLLQELVLRIVHQCNQRCGFCWVDFTQPSMDLPEIEQRIRATMRAGKASRVAFTGGEPTLHPRLGEAVALAKVLGAPAVTLQTNATRVDAALAARLARAGLNEALVSLHSANPNESDALTAAPGTWQKSVDGIKALCDAGIDVKINHVITHYTAVRFVHFVRFVAESLVHPRLKVTVAVAGHIDGGPIDPRALPRHSTIGPHVADGLRLARALGVPMVGLTHPCGLVPCTVPGAIDAFAGHELGRPVAEAQGSEARSRDGNIKVPECVGCTFNDRCFGLRREYAQSYGTGELAPLREPLAED
ncbi:MAG: radical SAM protein [Deltaproteobacteria bacterium]|nr:radical SAM protein [Deltaproteobacteria bacterium]